MSVTDAPESIPDTLPAEAVSLVVAIGTLTTSFKYTSVLSRYQRFGSVLIPVEITFPDVPLDEAFAELAALCAAGVLQCYAKRSPLDHKHALLPADSLLHFRVVDLAKGVLEGPCGERVCQPMFVQVAPANDGAPADVEKRAGDRLKDFMKATPDWRAATAPPDWYQGKFVWPTKTEWCKHFLKEYPGLTNTAFDERVWPVAVADSGSNWNVSGGRPHRT